MNKRRIVITCGAVILLIGLVLLIFGASERATAGKLAKAPLAKTGEVAAKGAADPGGNGFVSVEGRPVCREPLLSPASSTPCLYYSYNVDAKWRETVPDKSKPGKTKTESKSKSLGGDRKAAEFSIDDGSGPVRIDVSKGGDLETESSTQSYTSKSSNERSIMLGTLVYEVSGFPAETTFTATETVIKPADRLFVFGNLDKGTIGGSDLILSTKSFDEVKGSKESSAALAFTFGAIASVLGMASLVVGLVLIKAPDKKLMDSRSLSDEPCDVEPESVKKPIACP